MSGDINKEEEEEEEEENNEKNEKNNDDSEKNTDMSGDINKEEEEEEEEEENNEKNEKNNDDSEKNEASLAAAELLRLALLANRRDALKTRTTSLVFPEPGKVHALTRGGEEFREILYRKNNNNNQCYSLIVLVYSMENCQPCRVFAPKIEHMARECGESLSVAFVVCLVNASDANRRLASEAGVAGFPRAQIFDGATGRKAISEDIKGANDVKLREVLEERAYNVEKFDRLKDAAFAALSEAKAKLVANEVANEDEERRFATLVKTVIAYASNAIEKEDAKYKRINVNGKAFTERVKSCGEEGEKCLRAFGFEKKKIKEEESGDESEEAYYEISPLVFDEFHENNPFTKREMRRVIDMLRALTG